MTNNLDKLKSQGRATTPGTKLPVLYLPVDGLTKINESASDCFKGMAATGEYFFRDNVFVKPRQSVSEGIILNQIDNNQLPSQLEYVFQIEKKYWDEKTQTVLSRLVNCKPAEAKVLLNSTDEMMKYSLPLRLLASSPVLIERKGESQVLQRDTTTRKAASM